MFLGTSPGKGKWNLSQYSENKKYSLETEILFKGLEFIPVAPQYSKRDPLEQHLKKC